MVQVFAPQSFLMGVRFVASGARIRNPSLSLHKSFLPRKNVAAAGTALLSVLKRQLVLLAANQRPTVLYAPAGANALRSVLTKLDI